MKSLVYNVVVNDGEPTSITVFADGKMHVASSDHPNFMEISVAVVDPEKDDQYVLDLFDLAVPISKAFVPLSERVSFNAGRLFFDGDEVNTVLTEAIVAFYLQGNKAFEPLVALLEKVSLNPSKHSRDGLYAWLANKSFAIHPDGDIVGYKGVNRITGREMEYESSHTGRAMVNGVVHNGHIPTSPGTIVEMPRSTVEDNGTVECSTGLHVGTWNYARSFAQVTLRVKVNPRDVVSVPNGDSGSKMRVCRYRVMEVVTSEDRTMLFPDTELKTMFLGRPQKLAPSTVKVPVNTKKPKKAAAKKATAPKKAAVKKATTARSAAPKKIAVSKATANVLPKFYEDFSKDNFATRPFNELRWLATEWEVKAAARPTKVDLVAALTKAASNRRRRKSVERVAVK